MSTALEDAKRKYYQYRQQGMSGAQAYKLAFPGGIEAIEKKELEKKENSTGSSLSLLGGLAAGTVVTMGAIKLGEGMYDKLVAVMGSDAEASVTKEIVDAGVSEVARVGPAAAQQTVNASQTTQAVAPTAASPAAANPAAPAANTVTPAAAAPAIPNSAASPTVIPAGSQVPEGMVPVGTDASGGTMIAPKSNGPIELPAGSKVGPNGETLNADGTATNANGEIVGRWAQGAGGALMFYSGYQKFQSGDKVGGGLGMAAGGSTMAAAYYGGASTAASVAGPLAAAYGLYELGDMTAHGGDLHKGDTGSNTARGAAAGASVGTAVLPGVGTAIGGILGGLYGLGQGLTASSKGQRQVIRDKYRNAIINNNIPLFDKNYQGSLADGTKFDFGKDKFGFGTKTGDIDLTQKSTAKAASYGNILAVLQGASGKPMESLATQFTAAATSNANNNLDVVRANYRHFFNQLGIKDSAKAQAQLDAMHKQGQISDLQHKVMSGDLKEIMSAPANSSGSKLAQALNKPASTQQPQQQQQPQVTLGGGLKTPTQTQTQAPSGMFANPKGPKITTIQNPKGPAITQTNQTPSRFVRA